jgi:diguanylate cyclase (GGDEF)-like protein
VAITYNAFATMERDTSSVRELLKNDVRLPSPPAIAVKIVDLVKREDFSFKQLASIIEADPALVSRILRLANSSFYGVPKSVSTIEKAISVLGANSLKNVALSFIFSEAFRGRRGARFDFDFFLRRAITAGVASQLLAAEIDFCCDETFITCLLQDIGVAAMFLSGGKEYVYVLDERLVDRRPLNLVEAQLFGYDHQEVGAELLKTWNLPESIYLPIRYHHETRNVPPHLERLCSVIRASDRLAAVYCGSSKVKSARDAQEMLSKTFGLSEESSSALIDDVAEKSGELLVQFDVAPGTMRPFSEILQDANQELAQLNLSYEMLAMAHKEAQEKAERLATGLRAANRELRDLAFRDDLTGLYNYRHFNNAMQKEIARCHRYGRPLSLVLLDVDGFKTINDTHGHPAGDLVLQAIANDIQKRTRTVDTVIRYAGDEFALMLPETDQAGAMIKAENCRQNIEALQIAIDGNPVRVTVSVGVASYDGRSSQKEARLLDAADRALYESKEKGRNCVSAAMD